MKTIEELEKRLNEYRLEQVDFPSYADLIELLGELKSEIRLKYIITALAKTRESDLIHSAFDYGHGFYGKQFGEKEVSEIYQDAFLEELE